MKDYQSIWIKWEALIQYDIKDRKELLDSFNIEVKKGFDVVARIASEELIAQSNNKLTQYKDTLEEQLANLILSGYLLLLIESKTDPNKANLVARTSTNELGAIWMESFEKDRGIGYIEQLDPLLSLILDSQNQNYIDSLLSEHEKLADFSCRIIRMIEIYFRWTALQGYIFGLIEKELSIIHHE